MIQSCVCKMFFTALSAATMSAAETDTGAIEFSPAKASCSWLSFFTNPRSLSLLFVSLSASRGTRMLLPLETHARPAAGHVFAEAISKCSVQLDVLVEPHSAGQGRAVLPLEGPPVGGEGKFLARQQRRRC